jgi:hypothetical protein
MHRHTYNVKAVENAVVLHTSKFTTNNTSAPDGLSDNLYSVTRTAAGKYTVVFRDEFPACLFPDSYVVGAAAYRSYITAMSTNSNGNIVGCTVEVWSETAATSGVKATGTLTVDTKANSTTGDYFILNDGQGRYGFEINTTGSTSVRGVAATGTVTVDTKANTTTGDYFILNDGQAKYGFELNTTGATASHHIAPVAATATLTLDTKANTGQGDYIIMNDGTARYGVELDVAGTGAIHHINPVKATGTITCDTKANTTDEDFFFLNDGQNLWCVILDVAGDSTALVNGTDFVADRYVVVDISTASTAADVSAILYAAINATDIQMTAADGTGSVTLTADYAGAACNTQQSGLGTLHNAWAVTDMSGGADVDVDADFWYALDISGATTAADIAALVVSDGFAHYTVPSAAAPQFAMVDNTDGTITFTQSAAGVSGNAQNVIYEAAASALAVTDFTGGVDPDVVADVWTVIDISTATSAADVSALVDTAINGTSILITSTDATGSCTLVNDSVGPQGNTVSVLSETGSTLLAVTNMTGGALMDVVADYWTVVDISTATTAADVSALMETAINATSIQITATDATGSVTLQNDNYGTAGNTQQDLSETGTTLLALTDMTGGAEGSRAAGDTTDYDVYLMCVMRNSKLTFR